MKRAHGLEGGGGRPRDAEASAKRQRQRYDDRRRPAAREEEARGGGDAAVPPQLAQVQLLSEQKETDAHRLAQRQKQIDYGKNTLGYDRYCAQVPRHKRRGNDPMTPDKTALVGKKVFDRMVSRWRQALHKFDPPELAQQLAQQQGGGKSNGSAQQESAAASVAASKERPGSSPTAKEEDAATPTVETVASNRSIFDNFDEADGEVEDDEDDDDDLL